MPVDVNEIYYRNAWFMGIPLYIIGYSINMRREVFTITSNQIFLLLTFSCFTYIVETIVINKIIFLYINSILFAILFLILALKFPKLVNANASKLLVFYGKNLQKDVYLIHYIFVLLMIRIEINPNLGFLLIVGFSILFSYIIWLLKANLKRWLPTINNI